MNVHPVNQLEVRGLTRAFGEHYGLIELDATFNGGEICALLGPNGAGKSTLMNLLSTLMTPTEGHILLNGQRLHMGNAQNLRRLIGFVGHKTMLYGPLTATENLIFFAELYGLTPSEGLQTFVHARLEEVELGDVAHRPARGFSRGMAQRLTLARALLPDPAILLLDEPFTGLDQGGIVRAETLITAHRDRGAVIILSSHDLTVTERLSDRALILRRGRRAFFGPLPSDSSSLTELYHQSVS